MTNPLDSEFNPQEDVNSQNDLVEQTGTSQPKVEGFSSLIENVKNKDKSDIPTNVSDIPPVTVRPTDDPLEYMGKFVKGQVVRGQEETFKFDYDKYAPYFGGNLGYFTPASKPQLDTQRAHEQGIVEEWKNAAGRITLNIVPEIISQLANTLDLEDYFNSDNEVGNWLSEAMKNIQTNVNEALPIYRENPDKPLDWGDSAYWFDNGANLVTSAAAFVATGYLTAGATSTIFTKGGQATKWLSTLGKESQISAGSQKIVNAANTVANAAILNQAESVGIGVDTFKQVYESTLKELQADPNNIGKTPEQLDNLAKSKAAKAASSAVNFNRLNILLNLSSADLFLKNSTLSGELLKPRSFKKSAKRAILEGGQEALEENINDISKEQAIDEDYTLEKALKYMTSKEGIESGFLGFLGGAGQTALTNAGKYLPIYKNKEYHKAYINAYSKLSDDLSEEQKIALAEKDALEKVGTDKKLVSANYLNDRKYIKQQALLEEYNNLSKTDKVNDFINTFSNANENVELIKNIREAEDLGQFKQAEALKSKLFTNQVQQALDNGTVNNLLELYKGFESLSKEEAEAKGLYTEGDETSPNYYKTKANKAIKDIKYLSEIYNQSNKYINSTEVFDTFSNIYNLNNSKNSIKRDIEKEFKEAEEMYKDDSSKHPSINSAYIDSDTSLGYNLNNVTPGFKSTPSYERLTKLVDAYNTTTGAIASLQARVDTITKSTYQNTLGSKIDSYKASKQVSVFKKKNKETAKEQQAEAKTKVDAIKNSLVEDESEYIEPESPVGLEEGSVENKNTPVENNDTKDVFKIDTSIFTNPALSNSFEMVNKLLSDTNLSEEERLLKLETGLPGLINNRKNINEYFPDDIESFDNALVSIQDIISKLKEKQNTKNINKSKIQQLQQDLIDDLLEVNQESDENLEETNSASTNKFDRTFTRLEKLRRILEVLEEDGLNINDFKAVIKSFEENTNKEEVLEVFDKLKYLYNLLNNTTIEGSYEALILGKEEKQSIVDHVNKVSKFVVEDEVYYDDLDNISQSILQMYADLAILNGIEAKEAGFSTDIYNNTASNKLAYLAKRYNLDFQEKYTSNGVRYISVSKKDIDNLLNETLDDRVLSNDFIQKDTTIEFIPLEQVTLEDGTIRTKAESTIDNSPIGIAVNGELIDGLYLHDVNWANATNLSLVDKEAIEAEQEKLRALRKRILESNSILKTTVTYKSTGVPILNKSDEVYTLAETMPEIPVGVIKNGQVFTSRQYAEKNLADVNSLPEGSTAILIPFGTKQLALPVKRFKLDDSIIDSIISATTSFLEGTKTKQVEELANIYGINVLDSKGLEQYINQFIALSRYSIKDESDFKSILNNLNDNINIVQFANGDIYYGTGQGITLNHIGIKKNKGEERQKDLNHFRDFLKNLYYHVNLDLLGNTNNNIYKLENDSVSVTKYDNYIKSYIKNPYLSMTLSNGEKIYTIQNRILFDYDSIIEQEQFTENNVDIQKQKELALEEAERKWRASINEQGYPTLSLQELTNQVEEQFKNKKETIVLGDITLKQSINKYGAIENELLNTKTGEGVLQIITEDGKVLYAPLIGNNFVESLSNFSGKTILEQTNAIFSGIPINELLANFKNKSGIIGTNNSSIELPNGTTFSFDDVTEDDLSPTTTNKLEDKLLENSSLIKGVSLHTQTTFIRNIVNTIITEYIDNKNTPDFELNIGKQISVAFDTLDFVREYAENQNYSKKDLISKQVDLLKENKYKLAKQISIEVEKRIKGFKKENETDNLTGLEDVENVESWDENLTYTINPITTLSTEVKEFLEGIVDRVILPDGTTKKRKNLLGLEIYVPSDVVFNNILNILGKTNNDSKYIIQDSNDSNLPTYVTNTIELLKQELNNYPYLEDVINKLEKAELHMQNAFVTALSKTHTNHIYIQATYNTDTKSYAITRNKASYRNVANLVLSEWQTGIVLSNFVQDNKINNTKLEEFNTIYNNLKDKEVYTYNELKTWLDIISINLPLDTFKNLSKFGITQQGTKYSINDMFNLPNGIFKNIHDRINKFNEENNSTLTLENNNIFEDSSFKQLAYYISLNRPNLFTDNFKNGNGDTIYGWSNSRFVPDRVLDLKTDTDLLNRLQNDLFASNNYLLKDLFIDVNGKKIINKNSYMYNYLEYGTSDSLKIKKNKTGVVVENLNEVELEKYHLGLFYNRGLEVGKGNTAIPIFNFVYPTMSDKANTFIIQLPGKKYKLGIDGKIPAKDIKEFVQELVLPEITRIKVHNNNSKAVDIKAWQEGGNKFLLFPTLNNIESLFDAEGKLLTDVGISEEHWVTIINEVKQYLNQEIQNKLKFWKESGIVKDNNGNLEMSFIDSTYVKNNNNNAFEVAANYVLNTMLANMTIQQLFIGDPVIYYKKDNSKTGQSYYLETADNLGKRLAGDNAAANEIIADKNETFNVLVVNDAEVMSPLVNKMGDKLINLLGNKYSDYKSITSTDAQEYTTLEEHLNILVKKGELSESKKTNILDTYNKTGKVSKKDYNIILQPMKPRYVNNINKNGIEARLYIKSSSFPLIKELTVGTPLDTLREFMEKENINRLAHKSAIKVGEPANIINIYDDKGNITIPENWRDSLLLNVPRKGHGIQQEVPYSEFKDTVNDGTQQSKLLFTNLLDVIFINPFTGKDISGKDLERLYRDKYKTLFLNKYNKLIRDLNFDKNTNIVRNVKKLYKIIEEEALDRNYNSNDIASLELNDIETDFKNKLWFNNSDSKINALLNSIVDNRIRKRKFKGKSFVLASKNASTLQSLKGTENGIIKVGDWDGNLKTRLDENNNITYAEILIPFKFWDNKGKPLKITDFLNPDNTLDLNKIPEELLEIIGYRIPTSGVNLISTIKVVGFLPESYGDIVFAPDEFIVQMGSDFDVDKLYTHMYNTIYDYNTGKIEKLEQKHIDKVSKLKESIKKLKDTRTSLLKQDNKTVETELSINKLKERINILSKDDILSISDIEDMLIQNDLLDIHKAVLNNTDEKVQKARLKPISFGNLPEIAKVIGKVRNTKYFTILSNSYQQYKYRNARAGKVAVGIFSLDMVFNSVLQTIEEDMYFFQMEKQEDGSYEPVKLTYNISGIKSNNLNTITTAKGDKYKSDVIEAYMTSALDNEKEQLLGKLNINQYTFDFIRAMTLLGYDEDLTMLIINQPVIYDYIKKLESKEIDNNTVFPYKEEYKNLLATTTLNTLKEEGLNMTDLKHPLQEAILGLFSELTKKGKSLKQVQSTINSDSSGIGKNIFYSLMKANQILKLLEKPLDTGIMNANKLIGQFETIDNNIDPNYIKERETIGYYRFKNYLINPTSLGGFAGIYGTLFNTQLWSKYYPYTYNNFDNIIKSINAGRNDLKESIINQADQLQESIISLKSLFISNTFNTFVPYNTIQEARQDLLFDTEEHMSLGSIIYDLKTSNTYTNLLLDRLQIGRTNNSIDKTGKIPTDITYYNATTLEMDEEVLLNTFVDMIINDKPLRVYNNELLTTRILADKLITHQIITGGLQKSQQFLKYIPYSYLKYSGYYNKLNNLNDTILEADDTVIKLLSDIYRTQYIQHNPEKYVESLTEDGNNRIKPNIINGVLLNPEDYLDDKGDIKDIIVLEENNRFRIFKYNPDINQHTEIDKLGLNGINEYSFVPSFSGESSIYINKNEYNSTENNIEDLPNSFETSNFLRLDRDTTKDESPKVYNNLFSDEDRFGLTNNNLPIKDKYELILNTIKEGKYNNPISKYFAGELLNVVDILSDVPLYIDYKLDSKGKALTLKNSGVPVQIRINPRNIKDERNLEEVLLEEITHAVLKKSLKSDNEFNYNITRLRELVRKKLIVKYGEDKIKLVEQKVENGLPLEEKVERNIIYNIINNDEFIAGAIIYKDFQDFLNEESSFTNNKSIWQEFISFIKTVLQKLGIKDNSILEDVLSYTLADIQKLKDYSKIESQIDTPKFVRTVDYINKRFRLVNSSNTLIPKGNSKEIADFINKHISNVTAEVVDTNKVKVTSNILKSLDILNSATTYDFFNEENKEFENFTDYISSLNIRLDTIKINIKKAKDIKDNVRVIELEEQLELELNKLKTVSKLTNLLNLSDVAFQDLELVENMLNRRMNSEDILYARHIINFWSKAKQHLFEDKHNNSENLTKLYGQIEALAEQKGSKLFQIEKQYVENLVRKYTGKNVDINKIFEDYKDINVLQSNLRDISTYDNIILSTVFKAIKIANIEAENEVSSYLERINENTKKVLPILKSLGYKDIWEVFRQKTKKSNYTNHLVNPYNSDYYKDNKKFSTPVSTEGSFANMLTYSNWLKQTSENINLEKVFPFDGDITEEVIKYRNTLRSKVGNGIYDYWFRKQERKISKYNEKKEAFITKLRDKYNIKDTEDISSNKEAEKNLNIWIITHSPYELNKLVFTDTSAINGKFTYYNQYYYHPLVNKKDYLDDNFNVISNNNTLLEYYNMVDEIFDDLNKYVPEHQQRTLAVNGIPSIEKSIYEMYSEQGLHLGFKPIYDALIKSVQTDFNSNSIGVLDPTTDKPIERMNIPMIKDYYKDIRNIVDLKVAEFKLKNQKEPNTIEYNNIVEEARHEIVKNNSFDLSKILKMYSTFVLAHKHKSTIEDSVKIANNILHNYRETMRRPDGTEITDPYGRILKYDKDKSFPNTKEALDYHIGNIFYNKVREEEGKQGKLLDSSDKQQKAIITDLLKQFEVQYEEGIISEDDYNTNKTNLESKLNNLGKTTILSKKGDNILKYIQLKLMGWNVLGGITNSLFGYIANTIEASGGQIIDKSSLRKAYALTTNSILKNSTFNKAELPTAKKIRSLMDKWNVMKDASQEIFANSVTDSALESVKWTSPFNMNQRTEYLNQAPLMIALAMKTKINVNGKEINLWEGYDDNGQWKSEYGNEPKEDIIKMRLKLDQLIKRTHGNYDNLSPLKFKKHFAGRAISQFRTWFFEAVATRFEKERFDDILEQTVKGRYITIKDTYTKLPLLEFATNMALGTLHQWSFGLIGNNNQFDKLIEKHNLKQIDAINLKKVSMELTMAINVYLFLLLIRSLFDDEEDKQVVNTLINQGTRLKTDLLLYVNPNEFRNISRDLIPAFSIVKDTGDWFNAAGKALIGEDELESGVHEGDSRLVNTTAKMLPLGRPIYSVYNSASQEFNK